MPTLPVMVLAVATPAWFPAACDEPPSPGAALAEVHDSPRQERNRGIVNLWVDQDGTVWAKDLDLRQWSMPVPDGPGQQHAGELYHSLSETGSPFRFDSCTQTLWFAPTGTARIDYASYPQGELRKAGPSGHLNLDALATHQEQTRNDVAGLVDIGAAIGLWSEGSAWTLARKGSPRLESFGSYDDPDHLRRVRLGDDITRTDLLGQPVRYAGVRWGTDFSLQPDHPLYPLPVFAGEAALPSAVDLYVNGERQGAEQSVDPGPFTIVNPPVYTGGGEMQVAVRDPLGRLQTYSQPFYVSTRALAPGVADYAVQTGWQRYNYAQPGDHYDNPFGLVAARYGVTQHVTAGARAEAREDGGTLGASANVVQPSFGQFDLGLAGSSGANGRGEMTVLGFERLTPPFTVSGQAAWGSREYEELGRVPGALARSVRAQYGYAFGRGVSLSLAYAQEIRRDRDSVEIDAATISSPLGADWYGSISMLHSPSVGDSFFAAASRPLARGQTLSLQATRDAAGHNGVLLMWQLAPPGPLGTSASAAAGHSSDPMRSSEYRGTVGSSGQRGRAQLAAVSLDGASSAQLEAATGFAWIGQDPYWTRPVEGSFAVVDASAPDVRVYRDNQPVGVTGANGRALVPDIASYVPTRLSLDQQDLPLDRQITEPSVSVKIAPGGARVKLAEFAPRHLLLHLLLDTGGDVPAGAQLAVDGHNAELPVGFGGLVSLDLPRHAVVLEARWEGRTCRTAPITATLLTGAKVSCVVTH